MTQKPIPESLVTETENFSPESVPPKPYIEDNKHKRLSSSFMNTPYGYTDKKICQWVKGSANDPQQAESLAYAISHIIDWEIVLSIYSFSDILHEKALKETSDEIREKMYQFYVSYQYIPEEINPSDPITSKDVSQKFKEWLKMIHKRNYIDLLRKGENQETTSLDEPKFSDSETRTGHDTTPDPKPIEKRENKKTEAHISMMDQLVSYIKNDPKGKLRNCYIIKKSGQFRKRPECNAKICLSLLLLNYEFEGTVRDILSQTEVKKYISEVSSWLTNSYLLPAFMSKITNLDLILSFRKSIRPKVVTIVRKIVKIEIQHLVIENDINPKIQAIEEEFNVNISPHTPKFIGKKMELIFWIPIELREIAIFAIFFLIEQQLTLYALLLLKMYRISQYSIYSLAGFRTSKEKKKKKESKRKSRAFKILEKEFDRQFRNTYCSDIHNFDLED